MNRFKIIFQRVFFLMFLFICIVNGQQQSIENLQLNSPGPEHHILKSLQGNWRQLYASYPKNNPAIFGSGNTENKLLYNGRFIQLSSEMDVNNIKVQSLMTLGYDRKAKKYFLFGIDAFSTGYTFAQGDYIIKERRLILYGESYDSISKKLTRYKIEFNFENEKKYIYRMFIIEGTKEIKTTEIFNIKLDTSN